jgi:hypothetical protein
MTPIAPEKSRKNASYEGYYAISYPTTPLSVETYVSDALLGIWRVPRVDADQVQLQKTTT